MRGATMHLTKAKESGRIQIWEKDGRQMIGSVAIFVGCGTKGVPCVMLDRVQKSMDRDHFRFEFSNGHSPHGRECPRFLTPWKSYGKS